MTVAELIKLLEKEEPDAKVLAATNAGKGGILILPYGSPAAR
jgi:hypothetical protein